MRGAEPVDSLQLRAKLSRSAPLIAQQDLGLCMAGGHAIANVREEYRPKLHTARSVSTHNLCDLGRLLALDFSGMGVAIEVDSRRP